MKQFLFFHFKRFNGSLQEYARRIAKVTKESKLEIDEEKYVESFKPHLMDVVHAWCTGASFAEILKKTDIFEGIINCLFCINIYLKYLRILYCTHVQLYLLCAHVCFIDDFCMQKLRTIMIYFC